MRYILFAMIFMTANASYGQKQAFRKWDINEVQSQIEYCEAKVLETLKNSNSYKKSPRTIFAGDKLWNTKPTGGWTGGFWAGILWYVYEGTSNEKIKSEAEKFTTELEKILSQPVKSHDLGFIFNSSFGNAYRLTKNEAYEKTLLIAADSLANLYDPKVGTILSWPEQVRNKVYFPHNTIIDNMMNLELLFLGSKIMSDSKYLEIAISHADVTAKHQIRPNNTVYHVVVYDNKTGESVRKVTHQGYADESVWSRGQAWGIYGYTMCFRETGNRKYRKIAEKLSLAYLQRLSDDYIPFWDFDDPSIPNSPIDVSAATVVASAFLELSALQKKKKQRKFYRTAAEKILRSLSSTDYLSGSKNQSFLLHSTGNKPRNSEVDVSIVYADYYYIEALIRLKNILLKKSNQAL